MDMKDSVELPPEVFPSRMNFVSMLVERERGRHFSMPAEHMHSQKVLEKLRARVRDINVDDADHHYVLQALCSLLKTEDLIKEDVMNGSIEHVRKFTPSEIHQSLHEPTRAPSPII